MARRTRTNTRQTFVLIGLQVIYRLTVCPLAKSTWALKPRPRGWWASKLPHRDIGHHTERMNKNEVVGGWRALL